VTDKLDELKQAAEAVLSHKVHSLEAGDDWRRFSRLADAATVLTLIRAAEERDRYLLELQGLYEAFQGSGHSPKNPREAAQAIGQLHDGAEERDALLRVVEAAQNGAGVPPAVGGATPRPPLRETPGGSGGIWARKAGA
jgi:hypothetical protein